MAVVQCLYRQAMTQETSPVAARVAALKKQLAGNRNEQKMLVGNAVEPDYALVARLLEGIETELRDIDARIDDGLNKGWTRSRMSPLVIAILQCSVFEILFDKGLSPKIVVDEYTRITRSLCDDADVNFVHGFLSNLVKS